MCSMYFLMIVSAALFLMGAVNFDTLIVIVAIALAVAIITDKVENRE